MRTPLQSRLLRAFKDGDEEFITNAKTVLKVGLYEANIIEPSREEGNLAGWKLTKIGAHIVSKMRNRS